MRAGVELSSKAAPSISVRRTNGISLPVTLAVARHALHTQDGREFGFSVRCAERNAAVAPPRAIRHIFSFLPSFFFVGYGLACKTQTVRQRQSMAGAGRRALVFPSFITREVFRRKPSALDDNVVGRIVGGSMATLLLLAPSILPVPGLQKNVRSM